MLWKNNYPFPPFLHYPVAVQKHSPEDFLLCDVIGKPIQQPDGAIKWETECRRSVAPWECPLLLVDMWRPKDGFERRFEIQRKEDYEREEREREKEREREGENYQGMCGTQQADSICIQTTQGQTDRCSDGLSGQQACAGGETECHQGVDRKKASVVPVEGTQSSGGASVT